MKRVKITITDENGVKLDEFMVYDENTLTDEQADDLDFDPEAEELCEVESLVRRAIHF